MSARGLDEMNRRRFALTAGLGCAVLTILMLVVIPAAFLFPFSNRNSDPPKIPNLINLVRGVANDQTKAFDSEPDGEIDTGLKGESLSQFYLRMSPAVVVIRAYSQGEALDPREIASGIILDESGHILTSYPFEPGSAYLTVVFSEGIEKPATLSGRDNETGLTLLKAEGLAADAHPLAIAQSADATPGEDITVISRSSNTGGTIRTGLVSEAGSALDLGITGSSLPEMIRLAATLPDRFSGAPVFNQRGQFTGLLREVSEQVPGEAGSIRDIIPARFVQLVAPALVEKGYYPWAWLGVEGVSINLPIQEANQINENRGAYLDQVITGSPAEKAGLRGTSGTLKINGLDVPTGGDTVLAINGTPILGYAELLQDLAVRRPGEKVILTILQQGETKDVQVVLAEKPK